MNDRSCTTTTVPSSKIYFIYDPGSCSAVRNGRKFFFYFVAYFSFSCITIISCLFIIYILKKKNSFLNGVLKKKTQKWTVSLPTKIMQLDSFVAMKPVV